MLRNARSAVRRFVLFVPLLVATPATAQNVAQNAAQNVAQNAALNEQQQLGQRLLNQSCVVCHLKLQITGGTYAPALSKDTLGGNADTIRDVISNGSPHMPGFKIQFAPAQIDAITAYIKTIPAPAAAPKTRKGGAGESD